MVTYYDPIQLGETVNYQGQNCTVLGKTYGAVIIEFEDGTTQVVNKSRFNDLFGMNEGITSQSDPISRMVEGMREDIAERDVKIKEANKTWTWCSDQYRKLTRFLNSILSDNGAKSAKQLQGDAQQEYYAALNERGEVRSDQLRASSDVIYLSSRNLDDYCSIAKLT